LEKQCSRCHAQNPDTGVYCTACGEKIGEPEVSSEERLPENQAKEAAVNVSESFVKDGLPAGVKAILDMPNQILGPFSHTVNHVRFSLYLLTIMATFLTAAAGVGAVLFGIKYSDIPSQLNKFQGDMTTFQGGMKELQDAMKRLHTMEQDLQRIATEANQAVEQSEATRMHLKSLVQRIEFVRNDYMTKERQHTLRDTIEAYREYLQSLNLFPSLSVIQVEVTNDVKGWPHYLPDLTRLVLDPLSIQDPDLVCRFYTAHLFPKYAQLPAIRSGLAFYFPCSRRNTPRFAEKYARLPNAPRHNRLKPRNLDYQFKFSDIPKDALEEDSGEVWAAAFWEIRCLLGQGPADRLIAETARVYSPPPPEPFNESGFVNELLRQSDALDEGTQAQIVRAVFERRGWKF
jgi:hypothetical protein